MSTGSADFRRNIDEPNDPTQALTATAALVCALGLASCSDDDSTGDSDAADTVAVTHAFGTIVVPVHPDHALSFSGTWTNAFAELGEPVATQVVNSQFSDGLPWTPEGKDVAGKTVPVTVSSADLVSTLGLEAVADRNPDVIFAGYLPEQETYDKLAAIAPTVATVGEGMVDDWREVTTVAGEIVDKEEDAADTIEGTDSGRGRAVSAENIDMLDVDFLALWISGETPDDLPGWSDLHAVERGSAPQLDTVASTALGAPSVLSIPWVLDQLDPYLAALQEGDDE